MVRQTENCIPVIKTEVLHNISRFPNDLHPVVGIFTVVFCHQPHWNK